MSAYKQRDYPPGTRVEVFDSSLFVDDTKTPPSHTIRPATVIRQYIVEHWNEHCVDVRFDHRPDDISHGHFTARMRKL